MLSGHSHEAFGFLDASSQDSLYLGSQLGLLHVQMLGAKTNKQKSLAAWVKGDTDFRSIPTLQSPPSFTSIISHTQSRDWGRYLQGHLGPVNGGVGGTRMPSTCSEPAQRSCVARGTKRGYLHLTLSLAGPPRHMEKILLQEARPPAAYRAEPGRAAALVGVRKRSTCPYPGPPSKWATGATPLQCHLDGKCP